MDLLPFISISHFSPGPFCVLLTSFHDLPVIEPCLRVSFKFLSQLPGSHYLGVRLDLLSISGSPEPKYTPPHARHGFGNRVVQTGRGNATESPTCVVATDDRDDVFISPTKTLSERRSERSMSVANIQRLDVALANEDHALHQKSSNLSARHQINGVDAQNLYPPTACVFVAK